MALRNDHDSGRPAIRPLGHAQPNIDIVGRGPIPLSKDTAAPIIAILQHFANDDAVAHFAFKEDVDSGLPIFEVETTLQGDEFMAYYMRSLDWWLTQPEEWHERLHLAIW